MQNDTSYSNSPSGDGGYNYIITGSGCAGLSLLMRLLQEPQLCHKKILLLDQSPKNKNDRTWCFWEKEKGLFEPIVHHHWHSLNFKSQQFSSTLAIAPYTYKMIRGIDFYQYVMQYAAQFSNVEFRYENVRSIRSENNTAIAITDQHTYTTDFIFNSILFEKPTLIKGKHLLQQHFKGWVIETKEQIFDPAIATFMDFTIDQKNGTEFMYVLPLSSTEALVEYTLFTEQLLEQEEYSSALKEYISAHLKISDYSIVHEEFGIIPMTNHRFVKHEGNIVNIGIAGGAAKGSSGYAFQFIQKRTKSIVQSLLQYDHPFTKTSFAEKKFHFYDSVLLNVLANKKLNADKIFSDIFSKCNPETILQFLDNETDLLQDLQIIKSLPTSVFLSAALEEMLS